MHAKHALWIFASLLSTGCLELGPPPPEAALRPELTVRPTVDETLCDDAPFDAFSPPLALLDGHGVDCDLDEPYCFALQADLRAVAARREPRVALARSAEAFDEHDRTGDEDTLARARALADLAVTGSRAWAAFSLDAPVAQDVEAAASDASVRRALERAYEVAWALRGPPSHRAQHRAGLGWIAVSAEDDPPARPVNVPIGDHPQRDLWPAVALGDGTRRVVRTRALVASTEPIARPEVPERRVGAVPPDGAPLPADGPVLLHVPGHSSLAEEAAPLMTALIDEARRDGRALTIVTVDLPSAGYAERIDPDEILAAADHADDALLRFHDAFLVGVVEALGIEDRIAAVIGGSLGGNLALRLGELDLPWVRRVVAWSPASIDFSWSRARVAGAGDDEFNDLVKHEAVRLTRDESEHPEAHDSRRDYFVGGLTSVSEQAGYWYRDGWACKEAMIHEGLLQLGEIYDPRFRRWHYRVAYEQLVFSHLEVEDDGRRRFERISAPLLLLAGEEDDSVPMSTWSFAHRLAAHLTGPGRSVFLEGTGHAMHSERPRMVGALIWAFLREPALPSRE